MRRTVLQYQRVFNDTIEKFKKNDDILAVMVFGSIVTGDIWDESDIDLLIVCNNEDSNLKNLYTEQNGIPVHIKLMSKKSFLQIDEKNLKGGFIHRIISSSRLVFSKDIEITSKYDVGRYYPDIDKERWNMVYLGNVLNDMSLCKKYLQNDGIYTAYISAVYAVEEFSKLYVNSTGYMISKDAVSVAMNLNDKFKKCVEKLLFDNSTEDDMKNSINTTLNYIKNYIDRKINELVNILIDYMREKDDFLSSEEIESDKLFKNYPILMEEILNKLWKKNIIKREKRNYKLKDGVVLFKENIYFI